MLATFALLNGALAAPTSGDGGATTIMAVGDSITFGCGYCATAPHYNLDCHPQDSSYRGKLYEILTGSGHAVQMVGRVNSGDPEDAAFPENQHGHEGYRCCSC